MHMTMSLNPAGRMAAVPIFNSSRFSSRLLAIRGCMLLRAISGISVSSSDSAPDNQLFRTTPNPSADDTRPQIHHVNTEEASTSGRSIDPVDSNGQIQAAQLTALPNDPYIHPTQSWGGDEINSSKHEAAKTKPNSGGGSLAKRVVFGLLMGIAGASAVLAKPLFLIAATFITYHATIGETTHMEADLPCSY